jgi:hypothetical protein
LSNGGPVDAFDIPSLEAFTADLVAGGFEVRSGTHRRVWTGPVHPAFGPLTDATTMSIVILDGWPFRPPALLVDGLATNHSTPEGFVCLWRDDDASLRWATVAGMSQRIQEWCHDAQHGWDEYLLGADALLNFRSRVFIGAVGEVAAVSRPGACDLRPDDAGHRRTGQLGRVPRSRSRAFSY